MPGPSLSRIDDDGPVEVSVDEGGLRCEWASRSAYVPLDAIVDVDVERTFFGGARLVVAAKDAKLRLEVENCVAVQGLVLLALQEARQGERLSEPRLARDGRGVEAWLRDVAAHARGTYREAPLDLVAVLSAPHAPAEERAAAAHALLEVGDDSQLREVARVFVTHALPPIVLAAAHVARGGGALVPDDVAREMSRFLARDDAEAFDAVVVDADADQERRVAAAFEHAKAEALERARREDPPAGNSRWRRLSSPTTGGDTRWVGKTWAL